MYHKYRASSSAVPDRGQRGQIQKLSKKNII